MLPNYVSTATLLLIPTVFSAVLSSPENVDGALIQQLAPPLNLSVSPSLLTSNFNYSTIAAEPAPILNLTTPVLAAGETASNNIDINCRYGTGMNYDSCVDAFNTFQETRTGNLTIGPRAQTAMTYSLQYDLQLPVRWISGIVQYLKSS